MCRITIIFRGPTTPTTSRGWENRIQDCSAENFTGPIRSAQYMQSVPMNDVQFTNNRKVNSIILMSTLSVLHLNSINPRPRSVVMQLLNVERWSLTPQNSASSGTFRVELLTRLEWEAHKLEAHHRRKPRKIRSPSVYAVQLVTSVIWFFAVSDAAANQQLY